MDMVATIVFFRLAIQAKIEALSLPENIERVVLENLIPALYIQQVYSKAKRVEDRHRLREKSDELLSFLQSESSPFNGLDQEKREVIEQVAEECACLFQRASSCVEGRNGHLSCNIIAYTDTAIENWRPLHERKGVSDQRRRQP